MNGNKLTPRLAENLGEIYDLVFELYNKLEDIRPAGGFSSYIDESKYCKCCGQNKKEETNDSQ